jgi:hypothetical protein
MAECILIPYSSFTFSNSRLLLSEEYSGFLFGDRCPYHKGSPYGRRRDARYRVVEFPHR